MIRISDAAQAHFAKLLANQEEGTQIRVFVINPGTPNAECGVSYCPPDAVEATDTALKFDLLTAYVDELSAPYLEDAEIDFVTDQLGSQLTLKAPNAKMRKVADDAPLMERVEYMLQSQINPHFLFNALNTITAFCREKPEKARELLLALSSYFRSMLEDTDYMVTLDTELEHVKAYTMLEEARFEKRLSIEINADPEALRSCVPNLILQPIVENAVHHGAMQREKGVGKVIVNVKREERSTRIDVIDNGPGMDYRIVQSLYGGEKVEHTGIGMMNVQQRLISLYGKSYGLQIVTSEEGTDVRMNIPDSAAGSAQQEKTPG